MCASDDARDGLDVQDDTAEERAAGSLRIDKWLWFARFFKSRSLAAKLCAAGKVRINRIVVTKAHRSVRPGDVLTFPQARDIRVVKVLALGARRGPAPEARALYEDLVPIECKRASDDTMPANAGEREPGAGRPTKKERRALDRLTEDS